MPHGEIHSLTLGLIGFGRIGRTIARRAASFGMRILAVDQFADAADGLAEAILPPDRLPEMLAQADFVVIACPLTDRTRGLIGAAELAAMKPTGVLINVSRAPIADEEALYGALQRRIIGGAVLDVWYGYPAGRTTGWRRRASASRIRRTRSAPRIPRPGPPGCPNAAMPSSPGTSTG